MTASICGCLNARPAPKPGVIPDGLYDNRSTFCRERYVGGKMVESVAAEVFYRTLFKEFAERRGMSKEWTVEWETYQDVPK